MRYNEAVNEPKQEPKADKAEKPRELPKQGQYTQEDFSKKAIYTPRGKI
jgi:hypothetical protein